MRTCSSCRSTVPGYDTVHVSGQNRILCMTCWNTEMAELKGWAFDQVVTEPLVFHDYAGTAHTMHFQSHMVPSGHAVRAFELIDGEPGGYRYAVLGDFEEDGQKLFLALVNQISLGMARPSLEFGDLGVRLPFGRPAAGRIEFDPESDDDSPRIWIDGRLFDWHGFGQLLRMYEGFGFRLEIVDETTEV